MARAERRWCGRCRLNIVVSDADRMALHHIAPGANYAVIPNGVDLEFFRPTPGREEGQEERGGAVFVGETTWFPNRDALQYFCDEILPHMRVGGGGGVPPCRWVGGRSEAESRQPGARYGVDLPAQLEVVRPCGPAAAASVGPLGAVGGTRLK